MVSSGPKLLPSDMPGFMTLQHPGSELMSMAPITTKDHEDIQHLVNHLRSCWCPRAMLPLRPGQSEWPALPPMAIVTSIPGLVLKTMSGSVILPQQGSVLMFVAYATTKGHMDAPDLGCHL